MVLWFHHGYDNADGSTNFAPPVTVSSAPSRRLHLIRAHANRWQWENLVANPAIPWNEELDELLAEKASSISSGRLRYETSLVPWTEENVSDPRRRHLLCAWDSGLYEQFLAPHLNQDLVEGIFRAAIAHERKRVDHRTKFYEEHGPDAESPAL